MAMLAASPASIRGVALGHLHNSGGLRRPPTDVGFIILYGQAVNMAIPIHMRSDTYLIKAASLKFGKTFCDVVQV